MYKHPEHSYRFTFDLGLQPQPMIVSTFTEVEGEQGLLKARYVDGELVEEVFLPGPWVA